MLARVLLTAFLFVACVSAAHAQLPSDATGGANYSPPAGQSYPTNVYWGDTHLHTNMSVDANGMGNRALSPDEVMVRRGAAPSVFPETQLWPDPPSPA